MDPVLDPRAYSRLAHASAEKRAVEGQAAYLNARLLRARLDRRVRMLDRRRRMNDRRQRLRG